ncbi:MAG TPA: NAD(P)-dependent oxidoreductase, partial [Gammaproteobacteria bacterium]
RPGKVLRAGRISFDEMLESCDVISLHCPLTAETRHIIDGSALRRMRKDAFLINTARGGLVDERALVTALRDGWIAGAAFDVLGNEPPPADHPLLNAKLNNLIITPHNAWASRQARQRVIDQTTENIAAWLEGRELRRVV